MVYTVCTQDRIMIEKPQGLEHYQDWETQKRILLEYMQVQIALEDWHGVSDAAMDIRELQARHTNRYQG